MAKHAKNAVAEQGSVCQADRLNQGSHQHMKASEYRPLERQLRTNFNWRGTTLNFIGFT